MLPIRLEGVHLAAKCNIRCNIERHAKEDILQVKVRNSIRRRCDAILQKLRYFIQLRLAYFRGLPQEIAAEHVAHDLAMNSPQITVGGKDAPTKQITIERSECLAFLIILKVLGQNMVD